MILTTDEVMVIYRECDKKKRDVLEMIAIKKLTRYINKQKDSIMLPTTYNNVI